jgi:hypothetical protein
MNKVSDYLRRLKELVEIAVEERELDRFLDDDSQYADGFVAGYRQAMRDAANEIMQRF